MAENMLNKICTIFFNLRQLPDSIKQAFACLKYGMKIVLVN